MHGPLAPPRPDLFGDERQERRKQAQQHRQRRAQRCVGRRRTVGPLLAIAAPFHQLEVVVAEPPEERLGALQRARVVVLLERLRRFVDERRERAQHRAIDFRRNRALRLGIRQRELRRVQDLDREPASDAHLIRIEGRVGTGRPLAAQ
jgi:hypothetical protein